MAGTKPELGRRLGERNELLPLQRPPGLKGPASMYSHGGPALNLNLRSLWGLDMIDMIRMISDL
jgi:hypothetical protein